MEVVDIKKILAPNLLIYIYLHCARSLSWCATTLATLIRVRFTFTSKYLKSVSISVLFYHFFTEVHLKKFREGWQKKRKMMRFFNGNLIQRLPPHSGRHAHEISCFFNETRKSQDRYQKCCRILYHSQNLQPYSWVILENYHKLKSY